jgi:hypothetical protein
MGTTIVEANRSLAFPVLEPDLQISFYHRLRQVESQLLHEALRKTVKQMRIAELDDELATFVNADGLSRVASFGLRGEIFFPTPSLLKANPFLVGYYRLLLGFSQKEFYTKGPFGRFKTLEENGIIPENLQSEIKGFCRSLIASAQILVEGIDDISLSLVRDLQLLTLGPQFRGSQNTILGQRATQEVFDLIKSIVVSSAVETTPRSIKIKNDSGRIVAVEFSSDPDIQIIEQLPSGDRPKVSIEIKGGADRSNIHNRIGEAEKSHQKAKLRGFFEFWTILRVEIDLAIARRESPTTSHFFFLDRIKDTGSIEHSTFRDILISLIGIRV